MPGEEKPHSRGRPSNLDASSIIQYRNYRRMLLALAVSVSSTTTHTHIHTPVTRLFLLPARGRASHRRAIKNRTNHHAPSSRVAAWGTRCMKVVHLYNMCVLAFADIRPRESGEAEVLREEGGEEARAVNTCCACLCYVGQNFSSRFRVSGGLDSTFHLMRGGRKSSLPSKSIISPLCHLAAKDK